MTQDDMVKVARECGIGLAYGRESIERFYTFVAAAEKELIAQWVESWGNDLTIKEIVEGIRTNGNGATRPFKYVTRDSGEE